jgi:DNA-binding MarR family transcriptional regulator
MIYAIRIYMRKAHNRGQVEAIRTSLVELRRLFQRKELTALWAEAAGGDPRLDYADLRLLDAVVVAAQRRRGLGAGTTGDEHARATVGDVARLLGIDPSRASRQVARAVTRGLLERRASQGDARKVVLAITARGAKLQAKGSDLTRARIAVATAAWSEAERAAFARLFDRFVGAMVS